MRAISILFALSFIPTYAFSESVWVQVKNSVIRSEPEFYGHNVGSVSYGEKLTKMSEQDGWVQVSSSKGKGFVPLSAVSEQQIVLSARNAGKVTADSNDVVLAGKGFSKEVESKYKQSDKGSRFDLVDQTERVARVNVAELQNFARSGGLKG